MRTPLPVVYRLQEAALMEGVGRREYPYAVHDYTPSPRRVCPQEVQQRVQIVCRHFGMFAVIGCLIEQAVRVTRAGSQVVQQRISVAASCVRALRQIEFRLEQRVRFAAFGRAIPDVVFQGINSRRGNVRVAGQIKPGIEKLPAYGGGIPG